VEPLVGKMQGNLELDALIMQVRIFSGQRMAISLAFPCDFIKFARQSETSTSEIKGRRQYLCTAKR
jgi:hypothetical protein